MTSSGGEFTQQDMLITLWRNTIHKQVLSFLTPTNSLKSVCKSWYSIMREMEDVLTNKDVGNGTTTGSDEDKIKNRKPIVQFIVIGNPENRRLAFFHSAVINFQNPPAKTISWDTVLNWQLAQSETYNVNQWKQILTLRASYANSDCKPVKFVIRIESPGENFTVEKKLLELGEEEMFTSETSGMRIRASDIHNLTFDMGRIQYQRQWYLGFQRSLYLLHNHIKSAVSSSSSSSSSSGGYGSIDVQWMNHPRDILVMFDKRLCHAHLNQFKIPVPRAFFDITSHNDLKQVVNEHSMSKVFVKLAHGSSASGVVAYSCILDKVLQDAARRNSTFPYTEIGTTSVELVRNAANANVFNLYNSLRIRRYTKYEDMRDIIDTLCAEKVIVEEWIPKAKYEDRQFDLRVIVIRGEVQHFVVRTSLSPMTNLHLGNERGDNQVFLDMINTRAPGSWERLKETCSRIGRECFPDSLYMGVDVLLTPNLQEHYILEVNAFGDMIPRIYYNKLDTYHAEVKSVLDHIENNTSVF